MVHNLIRLSGLSPDDIPIQIIGARPVEKLYEGLVGEDEIAERSSITEGWKKAVGSNGKSG